MNQRGGSNGGDPEAERLFWESIEATPSPPAGTSVSNRRAFEDQPPIRPDEYRCRDCGAKGVRLWRKFATLDVHLRCADCTVQEEGRAASADTLLIGHFVPAVPNQRGYWKFAFLPAELEEAWSRLPLCVEPQAAREGR